MTKIITINRQKPEFKEPTAIQARGWLNQRTGKYFKAEVFEKLEDLKDGWVNGMFTGSSVEESTQMNAEAIGKAQAYADIILTLNEMTEDEQSSEDYEAEI